MSALPEQDLGFLAAGRTVRKQLTEYTAGCPEEMPWVRGREPAWPGKTGCLPTTNSHSATCSGETSARQDGADWQRGRDRAEAGQCSSLSWSEQPSPEPLVSVQSAGHRAGAGCLLAEGQEGHPTWSMGNEALGGNL